MTVDRPGLANGVRLVRDPVRDRFALLYPEGVLLLNDSAASTVRLCDGQRSLADIVTALEHQFNRALASDVRALMAELAGRRLIVHDGAPATLAPGYDGPPSDRGPLPLGLVAELTYRCPLRCGYCANPVSLADYGDELSTDEWRRVLDQARATGVLQVHFSGGEPLLRRDVIQLVAHARALGMYTNLVTSGVPLPADRLIALENAGLDHLQLSIQDSVAATADAVAGRPAHQRKLAVAAAVKATGVPLTINVVLHRGNLDRVAAIAELAVDLGADRVELAHTQFYGWARLNQAALFPTEAQIAAATLAVADARARFGDRIEIVHVEADYRGGRPKPCMNGWASRQFVVTPNGELLPCLAAAQLPGPAPPNARVVDVGSAWHDSELFNRFRGTQWLPEPCHSCARREVDFGGCRCQAFQLTGDAMATDPACDLSPHHALVRDRVALAVAPVAQPRRLRR